MIARPHLDAIVAHAATLGPARVAVAYPCNASAIEAVVTAQGKGLALPTLVGPRRRIEAIAGLIVSTAERMPTYGRAMPSVWARSIAFWVMSRFSISPGLMLTTQSAISSGPG